MDFYTKLCAALNRIVEGVVALLVVAIVAVVFGQVIARFLLQVPTPWSEELARYLLVWISFLAASVALRRGAHVGVAFFVELLPKRVQVIVAGITHLVATAFFATMAVYGLQILSVTRIQRSPAMEMPMHWAYSAIPAGGALMFLYMVEIFVRALKEAREGAEPA